MAQVKGTDAAGTSGGKTITTPKTIQEFITQAIQPQTNTKQNYTDYATKNYGANSSVTQNYAKANNTTVNKALDSTYSKQAGAMTSTEAARHNTSNSLFSNKVDTANKNKSDDAYVPYTPQDYGPKVSSDDFLDYYRSMADDALDDIVNSIMSRLGVAKKQYGSLKDDVNANYDNEIAQSEIQRYKGRRSIRNALANRGQLDSGLGRYETLYNDAQAQNRIASINSNRSKALNDIEIAIQQAEAQANSDIASAKNSMNSQLLQYALNNL